MLVRNMLPLAAGSLLLFTRSEPFPLSFDLHRRPPLSPALLPLNGVGRHSTGPHWLDIQEVVVIEAELIQALRVCCGNFGNFPIPDLRVLLTNKHG